MEFGKPESLKLGCVKFYADGTCYHKDSPELNSFKRYWIVEGHSVMYSWTPDGPWHYLIACPEELKTFVMESTILKGCFND